MTTALISSEKITTSIANADAYRIHYHSRDVNGIPTESTGLVIAPSAPSENRKVMSWAHGTTGLGDAACPSAQPDPARELVTYFESGSQTQIDYGIPGLQSFIDDGWIVLATDYQGLGTPGIHHYTVNRSNARDAVNIVHAAREMKIGAGTRFGVIGWSQGGGAAAATVELDADDYDGLEIVGAVAMSPGVPIIAVKLPGLGTALSGAAIPPDGHLFMILGGMATAFPDTLSLDDVFTPAGKQIFEANWNTQPVHHLSDILGRAFKHQGPVMEVSKEKLPTWLDAFTRGSATLKKPIAPVHVLIDAQYDGPCPLPWQEGYINSIKALGGEITSTSYPNDDHFSLPQSSVNEAREWLEAKF
jgi:pimeloyl-ACP methyl ester carboxylesterase